MKRALLVTFILVSLSIKSTAEKRKAAQVTCAGAVWGLTRSPLLDLIGASHTYPVWDPMTSRPKKAYDSFLSACQLPVDGVSGSIPAYSEMDVVAGRRSILSLGEGISKFIYELLLERRKRIGGRDVLNIHALDVGYYHRQFYDPVSFEATKNIYDSALPVRIAILNSYGENYHPGYYQDFELSVNGNALKFDEMVSSYSLNFVYRKSSLDQQRKLLSNILKNLNPRGVLRFWPVEHIREQLELHAQELLAKGEIRNFAILTVRVEGDPHDLMLIQK